MRKLWALALAPVLTLAFFMLGSAPANAFGSEVLGCSVDFSAWAAGSCSGGGNAYVVGDTVRIDFVPHNLSGTYAYAWTVGIKTTTGVNQITRTCTSGTDSSCIYAGCTTTSATCSVLSRVGFTSLTWSASLKLTQSGQSRTISASAFVKATQNDGGGGCNPVCP